MRAWPSEHCSRVAGTSVIVGPTVTQKKVIIRSCSTAAFLSIADLGYQLILYFLRALHFYTQQSYSKNILFKTKFETLEIASLQRESLKRTRLQKVFLYIKKKTYSGTGNWSDNPGTVHFVIFFGRLCVDKETPKRKPYAKERTAILVSIIPAMADSGKN